MKAMILICLLLAVFALPSFAQAQSGECIPGQCAGACPGAPGCGYVAPCAGGTPAENCTGGDPNPCVDADGIYHANGCYGPGPHEDAVTVIIRIFVTEVNPPYPECFPCSDPCDGEDDNRFQDESPAAPLVLDNWAAFKRRFA